MLGCVDRNARSNTYKSTALSSIVGFIDPNPKSMTTRFEFSSFTIRFEVVKSPIINQQMIDLFNFFKNFFENFILKKKKG